MQKYDSNKIKKLLDNSISYKNSLGLIQKWKENEDFRLGDQWASVSQNSKTKNFPRPVLNICDYIVQHKTSSVHNMNLKMVFKTNGDNELGELFTNFSENEWERLKIDDLNSCLLEDAAIKGVSQVYYYIEPAKNGRVKLQRELVDPTNFHVSNPKNNDIQKQSWIIVVQRLPLEDIKDLALAQGKNIDITEEKEILGSEYTNSNVDIDGIEKANLINFFYKNREDGKIHLIRICGEHIIVDDFDLLITKFPFTTFQWTNKTEDYYSKSEIDYIKPNQRQINTLMGLQLMNQQLAGFPKMWAKKGSLNPNSVKGTIGEILIDNSQGQGLNFGWLQPAPLNQIAQSLNQSLIDYTKELSGAHDVSTGAAKMDNASAILALQKRAGVALDKIRRKYHQYIEDTGLLWLEFFCKYYILDREFVFTNELGQEEVAIFNASDVEVEDLTLKIDVGASSQWSEEFTLNSLDKFLQMGLIDFKTYLKHIPDSVVPFKNSLLRDMEIKEEQAAEEAKEYILEQLSPTERKMFENLPEEGQARFLKKMAEREEQAASDEQIALQQSMNTKNTTPIINTNQE